MYSFWDWRGHAITLAVIVGIVCLVCLLGLIPGWVWVALVIASVLIGAYLLVWHLVTENDL